MLDHRLCKTVALCRRHPPPHAANHRIEKCAGTGEPQAVFRRVGIDGLENEDRTLVKGNRCVCSYYPSRNSHKAASMLDNITVSDWLLILATIAGPVLAVQAQKWVERARETTRQKHWIFQTLMTTRATRLSNEHVQALNMIEMVFTGKSARERAVIDAWRLYADHLNQGAVEEPAAQQAWFNRSDELFVDLLYAMAPVVRYSFDKVQLRRGIYYPKGHFEIETALRNIQAGMASLLSGERALSMKIVELPVSDEQVEAQAELQKRIIDALSGKASLTVDVRGSDRSGSPADG